MEYSRVLPDTVKNLQIIKIYQDYFQINSDTSF